MSTSTPADLAVAFRSLPRRLSQATTSDSPPDALAAAHTSVDAAVRDAAALLRCDPDSTAIAQAIESRELADWTDAQLAQLQTLAQAAARSVRDLEDRSADAR